MLVGEPARPADRPAMDREMRRDDPAGPSAPPPDLRDLLSRRHRATAPAGFRPHALDQRLLGAGGAIPESLPLSFVLVLAPGGFAIQKPPASAEEMTGPAPSLVRTCDEVTGQGGCATIMRAPAAHPDRPYR